MFTVRTSFQKLFLFFPHRLGRIESSLDQARPGLAISINPKPTPDQQSTRISGLQTSQATNRQNESQPNKNRHENHEYHPNRQPLASCPQAPDPRDRARGGGGAGQCPSGNPRRPLRQRHDHLRYPASRDGVGHRRQHSWQRRHGRGSNRHGRLGEHAWRPAASPTRWERLPRIRPAPRRRTGNGIRRPCG